MVVKRKVVDFGRIEGRKLVLMKYDDTSLVLKYGRYSIVRAHRGSRLRKPFVSVQLSPFVKSKLEELYGELKGRGLPVELKTYDEELTIAYIFYDGLQWPEDVWGRIVEWVRKLGEELVRR